MQWRGKHVVQRYDLLVRVLQPRQVSGFVRQRRTAARLPARRARTATAAARRGRAAARCPQRARPRSRCRPHQRAQPHPDARCSRDGLQGERHAQRNTRARTHVKWRVSAVGDRTNAPKETATRRTSHARCGRVCQIIRLWRRRLPSMTQRLRKSEGSKAITTATDAIRPDLCCQTRWRPGKLPHAGAKDCGHLTRREGEAMQKQSKA